MLGAGGRGGSRCETHQKALQNVTTFDGKKCEVLKYLRQFFFFFLVLYRITSYMFITDTGQDSLTLSPLFVICPYLLLKKQITYT